MIIGAILETSSSGVQTSALNGAALISFYTMEQAANWAEIQSTLIIYGALELKTVCTVINTSTGQKRWWYDGVEYTG